MIYLHIFQTSTQSLKTSVEAILYFITQVLDIYIHLIHLDLDSHVRIVIKVQTVL